MSIWTSFRNLKQKYDFIYNILLNDFTLQQLQDLNQDKIDSLLPKTIENFNKPDKNQKKTFPMFMFHLLLNRNFV